MNQARRVSSQIMMRMKTLKQDVFPQKPREREGRELYTDMLAPTVRKCKMKKGEVRIKLEVSTKVDSQ
jgi:hypothetical protein